MRHNYGIGTLAAINWVMQFLTLMAAILTWMPTEMTAQAFLWCELMLPPCILPCYRLFIQFSHTHLTFLSLAKGNFRGSFTPLWFSWSEFHQGTSFFRGYSYMSRRKVWERVRIQDMRLVFLPRKDGERKSQIFGPAKLFLLQVSQKFWEFQRRKSKNSASFLK